MLSATAKRADQRRSNSLRMHPPQAIDRLSAGASVSVIKTHKDGAVKVERAKAAITTYDSIVAFPTNDCKIWTPDGCLT